REWGPGRPECVPRSPVRPSRGHCRRRSVRGAGCAADFNVAPREFKIVFRHRRQSQGRNRRSGAYRARGAVHQSRGIPRLVLSRDEHCGKGTTLEGEREANPEAAGDHAEIAMKQWQCREGHANVGGGNAMLMPAGIPVPGPKGRVIAPKTGFWTMHNVVLSAAVFNVRTATCCYVCSDCCGYSCPDVFIDPDIDVPIEDEFGAGTSVEDFTGNTDDCTESASWTGEAQFTATALGETDVEGELFPVDVPFEGNPFDCPCGCPTGDLIAAAPVEVVTPVHIDSITPSAVLVGTSVDVEIDGSGFSSPASVSISGSGITASSVTVVSATEIDATFAIATTASNSVNVSVTANGVPSDNSVAFVPQYPRLRVFSDNAQDLSSGCTSQGLLGYSLRNITYDIVDQNGNTIQMQNGNGDLVGPNIAEVFNSISSNSCGNGTPPPTSCTAANVTQFTDHLFVGCNTVGGSCGYTLTNQWRTCPAGGSQAPIGTTAWTIHNNATTIVIGGISYSLPGGNQVPTGTIIAP